LGTDKNKSSFQLNVYLIVEEAMYCYRKKNMGKVSGVCLLQLPFAHYHAPRGLTVPLSLLLSVLPSEILEWLF